MMKPNADQTVSKPGKPTLEDLLRVKRLERPDEAFWQSFDEGLRQKRLAAMIEPAPWWLGFSLFVRRHRAVLAGVPTVVAVVFAFTLARVVWQDRGVGGVVRVSSTLRVDESFAVSPLSGVAGDGETLQSMVANSQLGGAVVVAALQTEVVLSDELSTGSSGGGVEPETAMANAVEAGVWVATASGPGAEGEQLGAAIGVAPRGDADGLTSQEAFMADLYRSLDSVHLAMLGLPFDANDVLPVEGAFVVADTFGGGGRATDVIGGVKAEMGDDRGSSSRARILVALAEERFSTYSPETYVQTRDRVVHRLRTAEEFYASASRLGMSGDRLSLRF